jgi:uncharacterized Fe-S center protein
MNPSDVYFTDLRAGVGDSVLSKLDRLLRKAGMDTIPFADKFVAIKIHFGEPGNLSFLRPNFAKVVADLIKEKGGKPFLTDCNTLYPGGRKNALDHLESAQLNGYSPLSTGCQIIIADGLRGMDEVLVPLSGTKHVKQAKIGRAIMDADIIVSLYHFKGHEMSGFGGALKNLGMGCGSRAGKMEQHNDGKPAVDPALCKGCKKCARQCAHDAISYGEDRKAFIDHQKCVGCGRCMAACNFDAISAEDGSAIEKFSEKMAEYALAVTKDRPSFHINIVNQVSPYCDCHAENDVPIIPDVGMFASFDPVALDAACADACNQMRVIPGSFLDEQIRHNGDRYHDHFTNAFPETNWRITLRHAEELGIGTQQYRLLTVK